MAHQQASLILLLLFCSLCAGKTFYTHLGTRCIEDCKLTLNEYKCKSIDKDGRCKEMHCSPQENMDYMGRQCEASSMCEKHEQDYYWCQINVFTWGYCGLVIDDKNHYGSYTGALCYNPCEKGEGGYYWCYSVGEYSYDYCSPSKGTDYKNNQCDGPCEKKDEKYSWCNLKNGGWGYCGLVSTKMFIHRTKDHHVCIDECQYNEKKDYYWCHTASSWDYCSPDVDVTYKGNPCRSDHSCGKHTNSYNWCWTSESEYDYCGPIEPGKCRYISDHRSKRAPEKKIVICREEDQASKTQITFTAVEAPKDITNAKKWKKDLDEIIKLWNNNHLVRQARSNLVRFGDLRIDMQGSFTRNNQLFYNLQVQVNVQRGRNQSTTISQVIVPDGVSEEYIRRAFLESFSRQARITIEVSALNQC